METEIIVGFIIAILIFGLSIIILGKINFMPEVELPQPSLPCPDVNVELTEQEFHRSLMQAKSGCVFNATVKFVLSDEALSGEAKVLGLVDKDGNPTVLKTASCEIPFPALIICNGPVFPGDTVMMYSREGVIIQKVGR